MQRVDMAVLPQIDSSGSTDSLYRPTPFFEILFRAAKFIQDQLEDYVIRISRETGCHFQANLFLHNIVKVLSIDILRD